MKYIALFLLSLCSLQLHAQHNIPPTVFFEITGMVKTPMKIGINDIAAFKQDSLGDVTIRNHKGDEKSVIKQIKGVLLKTILDSAGIVAEKPKDYNDIAVLLIASDDYRNVYSWNELYNTDIGNHVYVITEMNGEYITQMRDRILVLSLADINSGRRHLKGLTRVEVKKVQ